MVLPSTFLETHVLEQLQDPCYSGAGKIQGAFAERATWQCPAPPLCARHPSDTSQPGCSQLDNSVEQMKSGLLASVLSGYGLGWTWACLFSILGFFGSFGGLLLWKTMANSPDTLGARVQGTHRDACS